MAVAPSAPVPTPLPVERSAGGSGPNLQTWERILAKLPGIHLTMAFEPARVVEWTPEHLVLGFPSQFETNKELAESKDKLDALREVIKAELGQTPKITIKLIEGDDGSRSLLEAQREKSSAEKSKREVEAREHPITKHVLQTFGAQIKEIKTDV